jgi:hypothetical protein
VEQPDSAIAAIARKAFLFIDWAPSSLFAIEDPIAKTPLWEWTQLKKNFTR